VASAASRLGRLIGAILGQRVLTRVEVVRGGCTDCIIEVEIGRLLSLLRWFRFCARSCSRILLMADSR